MLKNISVQKEIIKNSFKIENENFDYPKSSWISSVSVHLVIIAFSVIIFREEVNFSKGEIFVQFERGEVSNQFESQEVQTPEETLTDEKEEQSQPTVKSEPIKQSEETKLPSFIGNADTSNLKQIYAERTLNVRVRFPMGWSYIDQNRKNKLDGVTFLGLGGSSNNPPIVHLEVKEKYLFNSAKYKFQFKLNDCIAYYNEAEEMEGYYTQIFYLVTETDEDYSLKLTVKGKENFDAQQPVLFAMLKSFTFGKYF